MPLILRPLQAVTNAPDCYDYGWMHTLVDNVAVDQKGRQCRLVENDDEWHFHQQLLRYGSGLHLAIQQQERLNEFLKHGWLTLTDKPVPIHRIKVSLVLGSKGDRRHTLLRSLESWRDDPMVKFSTGPRMTYYFECRGDQAAEHVRSILASVGQTVETWGPQLVNI